jgi:Ca-activated chloride channel homolog
MRNLHSILLVLLLGGAVSLFSQRIIIPEPPMPRPPMPQPGLFELELRELRAEVEIDQFNATTRIDQVFYNPTANQLQGEYLFPLPPGAALKQFSMFIDGKEMKGEILDAKKAKALYEDIVRRFLDPALLEFSGQGLARMRVFPIQPRSEVTIRLVYQHALPEDNRTRAYILPLSSGRKPVKSAAVKVQIRSDAPIKAIYAPSHAIDVNRKGELEAVAGMELTNAALDGPFELYFQTSRNALDASLLTFKDPAESKGFFSVNLSPGYAAQSKIAAKDVVFIVDASGSMAGDRIVQTRKALEFCIRQLGPDDAFNIVRFSTEANRLFDKLVSADSKNKATAIDYAGKLEAIGGTNVEEAFQLALQDKAGRKERPFFLLFFTDGKPTIGETSLEPLLKRIQSFGIEGTRVFTIGIGTELNAQLLDRLTEQTRGYRVYASEKEDIEQKVSDFYLKIAHPVLTDIEWTLEGGPKTSEVYPKKAPDLFRGETLALLGRYEGKGKARLYLKGRMDGKDVAFTFDMDFPAEESRHSFLPPLWGVRAVGYLLEEIRLRGESKELVDEVVRLSKKYGILTPYTSYLILEDEAIQIGQNRMRREDALFAPNVSEPERQRQAKQYRDAVSQEGAGSVRASEDIQRLNQSSNAREAAGEAVRVQGRALYRNNDVWQDGEWSNPAKVNRIAFNSEAYFRFVEANPGAAPLLSLGQKVRFYWGGEWWEVI